ASGNFTLVYHLSQAGFPFADSALQFPANSGGAPGSGTGIVGKGCAFNGSSDFLDAGRIDLGKTFTLSAWVNIAPTVMNEQTIWCNKSGGWNTAGFDLYVNSYRTNDGIIYFDSADGVGGSVPARTAFQTVSFGLWHLLTGVMDGVNGSVHVYVDGSDKTINTAVDAAFQSTNYVRCGALLTGAPGSSGGLPFDGSMDEARIENGVRSPGWVWASWATVADAAFADYGAVLPAAVRLQIRLVDGQIVVTWPEGALQTASSPAGPFSDLESATSPYTNAPSNGSEFFRVRVQ
ncbi:MAG TPA: LamG-like jellyroll fold domain-containing protein, partial [Verrucomicrobiae bacterium]|nr:LamG-like jellyroll fold domain-containing protein [Verrucomicrobiae bacterium]